MSPNTVRRRIEEIEKDANAKTAEILNAIPKATPEARVAAAQKIESYLSEVGQSLAKLKNGNGLPLKPA